LLHMQIIKKFEKQIIIAIFLGFLVAAALVLFGDVKRTINQLLSFNFVLVIPILLLTLLNYFLRFLRWQYFLSVVNLSKKLKWQESLKIFLSGLSMTITPGRAGEIIKAYFLKKILKNHFSETVPIVLIERLTDGLAALFLMAGGLLIYKYGIPVFVLAITFSFSFLFILQQRKLSLAILSLLGKVFFLKKYISFLSRFYETSFVLVRWKHVLVAISLGFLAWGAESIGFYLVLTGLGITPGINLLFTAFFIFCFAGMVGFATLLPGGLGVSEGTTTGLLMLFLFLNRSTAVAATLIIRMLTLWFGVGLGAIALISLLKKYRTYDDK